MTHRRSFVKAGLFSALVPSLVSATVVAPPFKKGRRHWVWVRPNEKDSEEELVILYKSFHDAGVRGIFLEADSEKHFRIARQQKLETHRWMWTLNRGEKTLLEAHPEWYSVNRKGESCADKPPYVGYYRWLCPSREEVAQYLEEQVRQILAKDDVDGIHLDYVRYCDVILPVNLWDNYKIEQTKELPEYDYCYCETCQRKFRDWKGIDIMQVKFPEANLSWRLFRYGAVTNIVNRLAAVAKAYKKPITAAVFPTPEVARRNVRQDWVQWPLNGICPMIYHGFYKEDLGWIGSAVAEGVKVLHGRFPLYAGLYLPDFTNRQELEEGFRLALLNGAAGIALFGTVTPEVLEVLQQVSATVKS